MMMMMSFTLTMLFRKFYIVVKKYKNDKYAYHIHEMYWVQAKRALQKYNFDYL